MRHALVLQEAILNGSADAGLVAEALEEAEVWVPKLSPEGARLYARLLASVERQDGVVMQRMRRNPRVMASLFALLPATLSIQLFGFVEAYDENWLADVERSVPAHSPLAGLVAGRAGFLRAVFALTRIVQRTREAVRSISTPSL